MKVLFFTGKVDKRDPIAGFAHRWIEELAKRVDKLYVVCLVLGETDLPKNVEVYSLGDGRIGRAVRFGGMMLNLARRSDVVFCHMSPMYTLLSAPFAKMYGRKLFMWHTHGAVTAKLRLAHLMADGIFTASESSIGIRGRKILPVGHGIDTDKFAPGKIKHKGLVLLSIGRISPIKRIEVLINGTAGVVKKRKDARLILVGEVPRDTHGSPQAYFTQLEKLVSGLGLQKSVDFAGPTEHSQIVNAYNTADVFVSASDTGSLDKVVLEAMACELPVVARGDVYKTLRGIVQFRDEKDFPQAVEKALAADKKILRKEITENHDLGRLMDKIVRKFEEAQK